MCTVFFIGNKLGVVKRFDLLCDRQTDTVAELSRRERTFRDLSVALQIDLFFVVQEKYAEFFFCSISKKLKYGSYSHAILYFKS